MLKERGPQQLALEMVSLDSLVPNDHLLCKIDTHIDFSFIHEKVAHLYCAKNGRPALDPTMLFKALLIGYLFGIRSEHQLIREIEVNVAYRYHSPYHPEELLMLEVDLRSYLCPYNH